MRISAPFILSAAVLINIAASAKTQNAVIAGGYALDSARSKITAKVSYLGLSNIEVTFPKVEGTLGITGGNSNAIALDVNVDTPSMTTGSKFYDGFLKGKDFFHTDVHPTIRFKGDNLAINPNGSATVWGTVTVRGVTRPTVLNVTFNAPLDQMSRSGRVSMVGRTVIKRSEFGMTAYSGAVGNNANLTIYVDFLRR
jgi:polyisoprenoid-binding protein YceI